MMEKVKISKIELVVNKKKIELTINEAMELKGLLNKTFDNEQVVIVSHPVYPHYPVYPWWDDPYTRTNPYYNDSITWAISCQDDTLTYSNAGT